MSCPCKKAVNIFDAASTPYRIGKTGENVYQEIEFNFSKWLSEYPDAKIDLLIRAPKNGYYLLAEGITESTYLWKPTAFDLANPGRATVMARMSSGEVRAKSDPIPFEIVRSMDYNLDISEPGPTRPSLMDEWIEDIYEAAARYPKIGEDGYWYVWDVENGEWVNTGVKATGEDGGSATVIVTVDDTTDPMTASMTAAEIKAAADQGERVVLSFGGFEIPYLTYFGQTAVFSKVIDVDSPVPVCMTLFVAQNGRVTATSTPLARRADVPTTEQMAAASIFIAVRGTTTEEEIRAAHSAGKVVICVYQNRVYYLSDDGEAILRTAPDAQGKVYALVVTGKSWLGINYNLALASAIPTKTSQLINDSIKEPYYLTVTDNDGTITVDKTPAEIDALSTAGYDVHLYHVLDGGIQIRIDYRFCGYIPFAGLAALTAEYAGVSYAAVVHADKTVKFTLADFDGRIGIIEGDISTLQTDKADKTEIPTKVSDLINDSGYQTAQDVQTAIAAKYTKPSGGIPKTDLASDVQASLGKADSALQQHQDISGKVDKVTGKGLSTNDYTTAEKQKLAGIEAGAQVNVITGISVNGAALTPQDGVVDVAVPTDYVNTFDFEDRTGSMRIVLSYSNGVVALGQSETTLDRLIAALLNSCNVWFLLPTAYITGIPSNTDMMRFWVAGANLNKSAPTISLTSVYNGNVYHAVLSPVSEYRMEGQLNVYNIALPSAESNSFGGA